MIGSCPLLEELAMVDIVWQAWESCFVASSSLKSLKITWDRNGNMDDHDLNTFPESVSFYCPNLLYLEYTDYVAAMYPIVTVGSLVEARINVQNISIEEEVVGNDVSAFMMQINHVKRLWFTAKTLKVLENNCNPLPIFSDLDLLLLESCHEQGWDSLPNLLNNSPNLTTLVFHGLFHTTTERCGNVCPCLESDHSCLSESTVRVLEIHEKDREVMEGTDRFLAHVRHLLLRMPNLQQVTIYAYCDDAFALLNERAVHLRGLPARASPYCPINILRA